MKKKVNLCTKSCFDISELEDNQRNCSERKKLLETKKIVRNTRSCQKVAEQIVEIPTYQYQKLTLSNVSSFVSKIFFFRDSCMSQNLASIKTAQHTQSFSPRDSQFSMQLYFVGLSHPLPAVVQVLFPATFIVHCRQHCTNCSSSCSRSIIENEFEGKLALSSTYPTSPPPHFYCFPFLDPPPLPPHYLLFLLLLLLIFSIVFPPRSPPPHPFPPPHTQN